MRQHESASRRVSRKSLARFGALLLVIAVPLAVVTKACNEPPAGVAGLSPAHWPNPQPADWTTFWQQAAEVGSQVGVHVSWNSSGDGNIPVAILDTINHGCRPVVVLGLSDVAGNPTKQAALEGMVRQLVTTYAIDFLGFGNEVDHEPNVSDLLPLIEHMAQYTRALGTPTQVFTVFQYELMLSNSQAASMIAQVPSVHFVGFTSFPFLKYTTTSQVPSTYYNKISQWTSKAWAITEAGWPSRQSFPGFPTVKGSETEQVNLIKKLASLLANKPVLFVNWLTICDLADWHETDPVSDISAAFMTVGLRKNSGDAKPAYEAWRQFNQASKSILDFASPSDGPTKSIGSSASNAR